MPIPPHELEHNGPPWKAACIGGTWCVTTDRGDPSDEFDVNESSYEWVIRLEAAAPAMRDAIEYALKVWDSDDPNERIMARDLMAAAVKAAKEGQ